ncbi:MAG: UbiA family prenyltransferase [Cytophagales bacterium]|nr:UbiA family prenyltransferase [Cytophagales bacterium]
MKRSTLLHLRFPFSLFLLPVFLFAVAVCQAPMNVNFLMVFVILHFLVYPASNGFNSYFDKDEDSIGGLKKPPKVTQELYLVVTIMDLVALGLSFFLSVPFGFMILIYIGVSRAYSHPMIRIKKYPVLGWLITGVFQGYFTLLLVVVALTGTDPFSLPMSYHLAGSISTLLLFGSYPMTQVYQHEEDQKRGDQTISLKLGILGTFHFTGLLFTTATAGFLWYFLTFQSVSLVYIYLACSGPVLLFFGWWYLQVRKDQSNANFDNTMRLNGISSLAFITFFLVWWLGY